MKAPTSQKLSNGSTYRLTKEALKARKALERITGLSASMVLSEALMEKFTGTFSKPVIELCILDASEYAALVDDISKLISTHKDNLKKWRKVGTSEKDLLAKIKSQTDFTAVEIKRLHALRLRIGCLAKLQSSLSPDDLLTLDALKRANDKTTAQLKGLNTKNVEIQNINERLKKELTDLRQRHKELKSDSDTHIAMLRDQLDQATAESNESQKANTSAAKVASIVNGFTESEWNFLKHASEGFQKHIDEARSRNSSDAAPYEVIMKIIKPILP